MPDSNTLVKINEQMYKSEKTSRDLRGYSLGGKKIIREQLLGLCFNLHIVMLEYLAQGVLDNWKWVLMETLDKIYHCVCHKS